MSQSESPKWKENKETQTAAPLKDTRMRPPPRAELRKNSVNLLVDSDPVVSDGVLCFLQTDYARAYLPVQVIFDAIFLLGPRLASYGSAQRLLRQSGHPPRSNGMKWSSS